MKTPLVSLALMAVVLGIPTLVSEALPSSNAAAATSTPIALVPTTSERIAAAPAVKKEIPAIASGTSTEKRAPAAAASTASAKQPVANAAPQPSPVNATSRITSVQTTDAGFSTIESAIIAGINTARAHNGLSALAPDTTLGTIARTHSADMLAHNYFSHTGLDGCSAICRYQNAGYAYWSMGENIYWMEGYTLSISDAAQKVVESWMNSPEHRKNNLGTFTRVGVGVAQNGTTYEVTADFATPR